jgi:uncharacterized protein (DUF2267 family)
MQYDEFIRRVQKNAKLDSPEEAKELTEVVLGTLGERLYRTERNDLAAQLPKEMKGFLFSQQEPEQTRQEVRRFSLEEFYNRVRARTKVGYPAAVAQTQAVMQVFQEAISAGERGDALATLPEEFKELLQPER